MEKEMSSAYLDDQGPPGITHSWLRSEFCVHFSQDESPPSSFIGRAWGRISYSFITLGQIFPDEMQLWCYN